MLEHFIPLMDEHYHSFVHKSGLRVLISHKKFNTSFAILGVGFGSAYEECCLNGNTHSFPAGTAHFLEHKLFENEDGEDTFLKLSRTGANANAYTAPDKTCYLFSASEQLHESLEILLQSVLHPYFTEKNVKKETGIIAEEIKMYKDDPADALYHTLLRCMYQNNPIKKDICGSISSVKSITPKVLYEAYWHFYTPENMVLSLCGQFEEDRVVEILNSMFPAVSKSRQKPMILLRDDHPSCCFKRFATIRRDIPTPSVACGIKAGQFFEDPASQFRRFCALNVIAHALFSPSGRLVSDLLKDNIVPDEPDYEIVHNRVCSHIIFASYSYDHLLLKKRLKTRIAEVAEFGVSEEEFQRAKRVLYADFADNFNSAEECATNLMSDTLEELDTDTMGEMIFNLKRTDVNTTVKEVLSQESVAIATSLPKQTKKGVYYV